MTSLPYFFEASKRRIDRAWFNWRCRHVRTTPAISCDTESHVVIVSQLYSPDVTMYLLAAKSFCRFLRPKGFVIVDDGLTSADRALLTEHLGCVEFVLREQASSPLCPRGGCWERLLTLSAQNKSHFAVQLDSDTLTISRPAEVLDCIARLRTFTLGTPSGREVVSAQTAAEYAEQTLYDHVQNHAERALARMSSANELKYVRGCAGFTGFAPGDLPLSRIEALAEELATLIGKDRFSSWGSEQVMSNLMAANAPNALVLPVDTYPFWEPNLPLTKLALVHFFGTFRFRQGMYLKQSLRVIDALNAA